MKDPDLFAYVGVDELDPTKGIGLKQGVVPAGTIPLVATSREKMERPDIRSQLKLQAEAYGTEIRLVRYVAVEVLFTLGSG